MNINEQKVLGVVVLYNPNFQLIKKLYESANSQLHNIVFIDNSKVDNVEKLKFAINCSDFHYTSLLENKGIATAQNVGIKFAIENKFTHVLLLDQDSVLPLNMVSNLLGAEELLLSEGKQVGAVGPAYIDVKTGNLCGAIIIKPLGNKEVSISNDIIAKSDYLIASGSLIRVDVLSTIGYMDEGLFIDLVDSEWCERGRRLGYDCFVVSNILLTHSIGDESQTILGKQIVVHSDFRHYFIVRNSIYLILYTKVRVSYKLFLLLRVFPSVFIYTYTAKEKFKKLKLMIIAIKDGVFRNMGLGYFNT